MRLFLGFAIAVIALVSCDDRRLFEKNADFNERRWLVEDRPEFEFEVNDSTLTYNLFGNVRNSLEYPYARIFMTWYLRDSSGVLLKKDLVQHLLFDEKTGEPFGESGLGDLYDHRVPLLKDYRFPGTGTFSLSLEQFMRADTLQGVLAVGVRVERASPAGASR